MKNKKKILIIAAIIVGIIVIGVGIYHIISNKNKLTITERNWINKNVNTVQNVNVVNNVNVFGNNGTGVYYDFLKDFSNEYSLTINPITFNSGGYPSGITLGYKKNVGGNDIVIYKDHYVLIGTNKETITSENSLTGKSIGVLNMDLSYVASYLNNSTNVKFTQYETYKEMEDAIKEGKINYMILPLMEYLDSILTNYHILYHFSDINVYFTLEVTDDTLGNIFKKYYNTWKNKLNDYYTSELSKTFIKALNIPETEIYSMQSVEYNYGFVNTSPYEVISGGKYAGVAAVILSDFSKFAKVDFKFNKYSNETKFNNAIKKGNVDLYFNYNNNADEFNATSGIPISYVVVAPRSNSLVVKSINSLVGKTVYSLENSKITEYLRGINGIDVKTFKNIKDMFKYNKKDAILVVDKNVFEYYQNDKLSNYTERYYDLINSEYSFKVRINSALYKLLDKYMSVIDKDEVVLKGIDNHYKAMKSGNMLAVIAEYIIGGLLFVGVIVLIFFKRGKKITIAKKIKKDEKIKFIDQLTSLKNRNFLTENIGVWTNNTIYPQAILVIDLNKIQEINDLYGYEEGDKQIKACANVLVKTQLDNSEIVRTDGNEFVVYLVGYNQKQVTNYIHKLNKEISKLPYEFGAEFGYSMIDDDIKTIEDALNEAVEDMKHQKEIHADEK